jgi:hypothetical protein
MMSIKSSMQESKSKEVAIDIYDPKNYEPLYILTNCP